MPHASKFSYIVKNRIDRRLISAMKFKSLSNNKQLGSKCFLSTSANSSKDCDIVHEAHLMQLSSGVA